MKRIVILGGGFGGLRAAMVLGKNLKKVGGYEVVLVDKNDYHTYTPTLYEISTTSKEVANYIDLKSIVTYPIKTILNKSPIKFVKAEVKKIDIEKAEIALSPNQTISYDYLILALGSETNFFGIPGLKEKALELKSFTDAIKIRDAILEKVQGLGPEDCIQIVIGGAGSTGVELAGELEKWLAQLRKNRGWGNHITCETIVTLIDIGPTILSNFSQSIIKKSTRRLKKLGTTIIADAGIASVTDYKVVLQNGQELEFDILIWAGGVKANLLVELLPLKIEKRGQIEVNEVLLCLSTNPELQLTSKVYAVGDIACFYDPESGRPIPAVARIAIIQGAVAAKNILHDLQEKPPIKYRPRNYPYIIPIGGKYAVARVGPLVLASFWAWILKGLVELNYLRSIMPFRKALKIWLKGLKIFIQNDRLG